METITKQGASVIRAHLEHLAGHGQTMFYNQAIEYLIENDIPNPDHAAPERRDAPAPPGRVHPIAGRTGEGVCHPEPHAPHPFDELPRLDGAEHLAGRLPWRAPSTGWRDDRIRAPGSGRSSFALLNPAAPYFDHADLLTSADCVPFAYSGFHSEFLRGRILIIFCPKLDPDIDGYIEKLAEIFTQHPIRSILVLHMEVPCCSGVRYVVDKALAKAGVTIPVEEKTVTIEGKVE